MFSIIDGLDQMVELDVMCVVMQRLLDFVRLDLAGEAAEVPFETLDVGFQLNGGISKDLVVIEISCASGGKWDFVNANFSKLLLHLVPQGYFSTIFHHSDGNQCVDEIFVPGEMKDSLVVVADFHFSQGHGRVPFLSVESTKVGGSQVLTENPMLFTNVTLVAVMAVLEIRVADFQREQL